MGTESAFAARCSVCPLSCSSSCSSSSRSITTGTARADRAAAAASAYSNKVRWRLLVRMAIAKENANSRASSTTYTSTVMGLLTIIKKQKRKDREVRCLVLGLDNAGKSTIVDWLLATHVGDGRRAAVAPTVGFRIHTIPFENQNVQLWDVGGQSTLRPYWSNYFDKTDVLVWVVDLAAVSRARESQRELFVLLHDRDRLGYNCRILVLLNKTDLLEQEEAESRGAELKAQLESALALENIELEVTATSGMTGAGLEQLLETIAQGGDRKRDASG